MHKMEEKMIGSEIEDLINIRKAEIELVNEKVTGSHGSKNSKNSRVSKTSRASNESKSKSPRKKKEMNHTSTKELNDIGITFTKY